MKRFVPISNTFCFNMMKLFVSACRNKEFLTVKPTVELIWCGQYDYVNVGDIQSESNFYPHSTLTLTLTYSNADE